MTEKWKLGYVTTDGEIAPRGTMLCNGAIIQAASGADFPGSGWVVVREAPEVQWIPRIVEVRGEGKNAQVRFAGWGDGWSGSILVADIAKSGKPAPAVLDREKVDAMLQNVCHAYMNNHGDTKDRVKDFLDYVCGKEGA